MCSALLFHASEVSKKLLSDYEVVILYHNINYNKCYFHIDKSVNISNTKTPEAFAPGVLFFLCKLFDYINHSLYKLICHIN